MDEQVKRKSRLTGGTAYSPSDALRARIWVRELLGLPYINPAASLTRPEYIKSGVARKRSSEHMKKQRESPAFNHRMREAIAKAVEAKSEKMRAEIPLEYQGLLERTSRVVGVKEARKQVIALIAKDRAKADLAQKI